MDWVLAVQVIAAFSSTGAFTVGIRLWMTQRQHDRDLYGDDRAGKQGVVPRVAENEQRSRANRRRLETLTDGGGESSG